MGLVLEGDGAEAGDNDAAFASWEHLTLSALTGEVTHILVKLFRSRVYSYISSKLSCAVQ